MDYAGGFLGSRHLFFCFIANDEAIDLVSLMPVLTKYLRGFTRSYGYRQFQVFYDLLERGDKCTLIENLWRFRLKECLDRRDIVYSLPSISQAGLPFEVAYSSTLADLALAVLRPTQDSCCLCSAKIVLQVLSPVDAWLDADDRPFTTLRIPPLAPRIFPFKCPRCGEHIDHEVISEQYFPSLETRFYCLGCLHNTSRVQCLDFHDTFRHGHLILARSRSGQEETPWLAYWIAPNQGTFWSIEGRANSSDRGQRACRSPGFVESVRSMGFSDFHG